MNTDTLENIRIEDPLDFLDASEKEEYIRERHRAENERLQKIADAEKRASAAARAMPEHERARMKRETDDPSGDSRRRGGRRDPYPEEPEDDGYDDDYDDDDDDDDYEDEYDDEYDWDDWYYGGGDDYDYWFDWDYWGSFGCDDDGCYDYDYYDDDDYYG